MRRAAVLLVLVSLIGTALAQDPAPAPSPDVMAILLRSLGQAGDPRTQANILKGINAAFKGRANVPAPTGWPALYEKLNQSADPEVRQQANALAGVFGSDAALDAMRKTLADAATGLTARESALESLVAAKNEATVPILRALLATTGPVRRLALRALAAFDDPETPAAILAAYPGFDSDERRDAVNTLVSRLASARALLTAMSTKKIPVSDLSAPVARRLQGFKDEGIDAWLYKNWGALGSTSAEKAAEIARYRALLTPAALDQADPSRGRAVFALTCQQCHTLFGTGGKVGPELTASQHTDVDYILENVINPNGFIGKDYQNVVVQTRDGQLLSGILRGEDAGTVTLRTIADDIVIARTNIAELTTSESSMMPEGLLQLFADDEVRDLVAYLRCPGQVPLLATTNNAGDFFNGNDLHGWQGSAEVWRVEQGELVGKSGRLTQADQLMNEMIVADGTLSAEIKVIGPGQGAILLRGERLDDGTVRGLRFSVGEKWGQVGTGTGDGGIIVPAADRQPKPETWNLIEMEFKGMRIRVKLNGQTCAELNDPAANRRGFVGFELAAPGSGEMRIRNLKLEVPPR